MVTYVEKFRNDNRKYTRFHSNSSADLYIAAHDYEQCQLKDLSMSGIFVRGKFVCKTQDSGVLDLHGAGEHYGLSMKLRVTVRRTSNDGVALELQDNNEETHVFLQTMVLYCSNDPFAAAQEFVDVSSEVWSMLQ